MRGLIEKLKKNLADFGQDESGMGVIEVILIILVLVGLALIFKNQIGDIADGIFRLHVIANSDSVEDQNLKYKVRDALLEYMNSICADASSKEDAMNIASENLDNFREIAQKVVYDNDYNYPVTVEIGQYNFPTKHYGDVSLPSGIYDALRVKIGTASGQNWWCVMFPPLCFVDVSSGIVPDDSKDLLQDNMSDEEYDLITNSNDNSSLTFKFKIVELFENIKVKLANS